MTKQVKIGNIAIGGNNPIAIQSMLNAHSLDVIGNVEQAVALEKAGCEIIRVSVPTEKSVELIYKLKQSVSVPIVADIHFDHKIALLSVEAGVDKIRINPGNIGDFSNVKAVANACKQKNIPIRIGVNSGSVEKDILKKHGGVCPMALVESAKRHVELLEKSDFDDIVVSIKSSNLAVMTKAYRLFSEMYNYPLHLGVTEAGTYLNGLVKSSIGIGSLLLDNIGATLRVSLTDDPIKEIEAANMILGALGLVERVEVISCPTCGRTEIDLISIAKEVEEKTKHIKKPLKVAVMGCVVNGPGEAKEADIGIAGGKDCAVLFKKGETIRKLSGNIADELLDEIKVMLRD